jgi:hypothetical protein
MTLSMIAGSLGLDEVEAVRPIPLTDAEVGPVPPRPKNREQRRTTERQEAAERKASQNRTAARKDRPVKKLRQGV